MRTGRNSATILRWAMPILLVAVVWLWYASSLRFGLIWDDPSWYQRGADQPLWRLFLPLEAFPFYRPLALLLGRALRDANGAIYAEAAHCIQVLTHTLAVLLAVPVLKRFGLGERPAFIGALLFAVHPFAYQAVAWEVPQQPAITALAMLSVLAAARFAARRRRVWLMASVAAYGAALLFQEGALGFILPILWVGVTEGEKARSLRTAAFPLFHALFAGVYLVLRSLTPRLEEITGTGLRIVTLAYLLQSLAYPVACALAVAQVAPGPVAQAGIYAGVWLLLAWVLRRAGQGRAAVWASLWIVAGLLPPWATLRWGYIGTAPRLAYPALVGMAALWAGALEAVATRTGHPAGRALSVITLAALLVLSAQQWRAMEALYHRSTAHLAEAVREMSARPGERLLFINFPDRLRLQTRLYPLGFWGLPLAPVVQRLSDYAQASTGQAAETMCLSLPHIGAAEREAWPYRVDMRGVPVGPEEFADAARLNDAVYLSRYLPDGVLRLAHVGGALKEVGGLSAAPVVFGEVLELESWCLARDAPASATLSLVWRPIGPMRHGDTVFVHLLSAQGQLLRTYDGDPLGGALPLVFWPSGVSLLDIRALDLAGLPAGSYLLTVGLYNRDDGLRYAVVLRDGSRVAGDEFILATFGPGEGPGAGHGLQKGQVPSTLRKYNKEKEYHDRMGFRRCDRERDSPPLLPHRPWGQAASSVGSRYHRQRPLLDAGRQGAGGRV
ncbi:MAG: hypothetical protein H5T69_00035 [Chloroflexi bacterium]|nr:hypothetical protein [Chloroflexota bacterium]